MATVPSASGGKAAIGEFPIVNRGMKNNLLQLGRACLVSLFIAGLKFLAEYCMEVRPQTCLFFRITPRPFLSCIPFFLIFCREDTGKTWQEYSNPCQSTETISVVNLNVVFLFTAFIVELWKLHASAFSQALYYLRPVTKSNHYFCCGCYEKHTPISTTVPNHDLLPFTVGREALEDKTVWCYKSLHENLITMETGIS